MDRFFHHQSKEQLKNLPRFEQPPGFKSNAKLFPYQKDGIRWLLSQERNPRPNPFSREQELKRRFKNLFGPYDRDDARSPLLSRQGRKSRRW